MINSNYKEDAKNLLQPFQTKEVYAVGGNNKKLLVSAPQEVISPFSVYDAQNNINANGSVRHIQKPEEVDEPASETELPKPAVAALEEEIPPPLLPPTKAELIKKNIHEDPPIFKVEVFKPKEIPEEYKIMAPQTKIGPAAAGAAEDAISPASEPPSRPLVRVRTELNLSESLEIAEGNNGPILVHEEDALETDTPPAMLPPMLVNNNDFGPKKILEEVNAHHKLSPMSEKKRVELRMTGTDTLNVDQKWKLFDTNSFMPNEKRPESKPLWQLPMSEWPKPKSSSSKSGTAAAAVPVKNGFHFPAVAAPAPEKPKELPLIKQKPKIETKRDPSLGKKLQQLPTIAPLTERARKPSDASIDGPIMTPVEKRHRALGPYYGFITEVEGVPRDGPLFKFVTGYAVRPRDGEEGEDACFTCERGLGVADGVSGWVDFGINPSAFSQKLMEECENEIRHVTGLKLEEIVETKKSRIPKVASYVALDFHANTVYGAKGSDGEDSGPESECSSPKKSKRAYEIPINSMQILSNAYEKVDEFGSSTATVVVLNGNEIEAVNLGDSGFVHLTLKAGEYYINGVSKEQQHEFNVPYQMSRLPPAEYLAEMEREGRVKDVKKLKALLGTGKMCKDNPESADQYNQEVADGDIFVLGTDGVFDNLFSYEIKNVIRDCMRSVSRISQRVAKV